jgi:hypothetical protein
MKFLPIPFYSARRAKVAAASLSAALRDPASLLPDEESHLLKTLGLLSAALGAVALGLVVGREIRQRYKFNRQTPYDLYAHSGDEADMEYSVGI